MNTFALSRFQAEQWLITTAGALGWVSRMNGQVPQLAVSGTNFFGDPIPKLQVIGSIAVIPIWGVLINHADTMEKGFGAMAHEDVAENFRAANAMSKLTGIVADFRSPGGTLSGTPETAQVIQQSRLPVLAFTDATCASAAYFLAAACRGIYATESAQVGSVGVMLEIANLSKALAEQGISVDLYTSGKLKGAGNPFVPVQDAHREHFQSRVNQAGTAFRNYVSSRRRVGADAMEGQSFFAPEALSVGLIDGIVSGIGEVLTKIGAGNASVIPQSPSVPAGTDDFEAKWRSDASIREEFLDDEGAYRAYVAAENAGRIRSRSSRAEQDSTPNQSMESFDSALKEQWNRNANLRAEFLNDFETYQTYATGVADGRIISNSRKTTAVESSAPMDSSASLKAAWDRDPALRDEWLSDFKSYETWMLASAAGRIR